MESNSESAGMTTAGKKPRLAYAIATVLGVGYAPKAPGTFGALAGVLIAALSAILFLRPTSLRGLVSVNPLSETQFTDKHLLALGIDIHDAALALPLLCTLVVVTILIAVGVWSATRVALHAGSKDPQFVVIDEVSGQHLTLLLPLIPIALPHLTAHGDFSVYTIFFALSLLNWKYLLAGFILFRVFDIWKPFPVRQLERLPGGWGIMADDWMAGIYAAILLRVALHFGLV
jgi:phosphatidylglycerophosphatase A